MTEPYVVLYLAVLLVWPWPELMHRFLLPVLPLLLLYVWRGARRLLPGASPVALALVLGPCLLGLQARSAWHAWHRLAGAESDGRTRMAAVAARDWIRHHTPANALVASEWAAWLHWQTRRPVRFVQIRPEPEVLADALEADFLVVSSDDPGRLRRAVALAPERFTAVAGFGAPDGPRWQILARAGEPATQPGVPVARVVASSRNTKIPAVGDLERIDRVTPAARPDLAAPKPAGDAGREDRPPEVR